MRFEPLPIWLALNLWAHAAEPGRLRIHVVDRDGNRIPARVNVIGSDNAFHQPDPSENPLAEYDFKRQGNRSNVGPLRYVGSFFYTTGTTSLKLPPGIARVEVSKGYSWYLSAVEAAIRPGRTTNLDVVMRRMVDLNSAGWRSADTHLHFSRTQPEHDRKITELLSAEGVDLGYVMADESVKGFGAASTYSALGVSIASGQEIVTSGLGHINSLMPDRPIPSEIAEPGAGIPAPRTNSSLAAIYDHVIASRGALQHDHGGYGQEIYADIVLGKSDWVELLQFAAYRARIGLDGYYLALNSGYRYPLAGGSDYPSCRTLADTLTYVAGDRDADLASGVGHLLRGEAFGTSGPLLFLSVNGKGPGSDLTFDGGGKRTVDVRVLAVSANLPFTELEIVQDGKAVASWRDPKPVFQKELKTRLELSGSSWIAARCEGPETAHAHTNPVWVYFDGRAPFQPGAAKMFLERLRAFAPAGLQQEPAKVLASAREKLENLVASGVAPVRPAEGVQRFPVRPAEVELFPTILPRPPASPITVKGIVVDTAGRGLPQALVSPNGEEPAARTDAAGRFRLQHDARRSLFLRVSKPGYAITNTSYLNPKALNPRIVVLRESEVRDLEKSLRLPSDAVLPEEESRAIVLVHSAGANGKPIAGLTLEPSPRNKKGTEFPYIGYAGVEGRLTEAASISASRGPAQMVVVAYIDLQEIYPVEKNPREPNLILTVKPSGKDLVIPAIPRQIGYAVVQREMEN